MCPSEDERPLRPSVQVDPNSALGRALLASPLDGALDGKLRSYRGRRLLILVVLSFYWFVPTDIFVDIWAAADLSLGACRCVGEGWSVAVNASAADPCAACAAGGGRVDCPLDADLTTMAGEFELYCESTWMLSLGPSVDMAGIAAGSLLGGALSDRFGRRRAFLGFFALQCLSYACSSAAPSMGVYFALKLLVGVFGGAANVAGFTLACELVGASLRTPLTVELWAYLFAVMEVFCALMASAMRDAPWRSFVFVMSLPACTLWLVSVLLLPESVLWLQRKGSAHALLVTLRTSILHPRSLAERLGVPEELWLEGSSSSSKVGDGTKVVSSLPPPPRPPPSPPPPPPDDEAVANGAAAAPAAAAVAGPAVQAAEAAAAAMDEALAGGGGAQRYATAVRELFATARGARILLVQMYMWAAVALAYYGVSFNAAQLSDDPYTAFALSGLTEIPATFVGARLMDHPRLGRRVASAMSMLIIAVSLGVGAASPAAAVPLALVGKFFACAAFNLIYVQTGELFETASRNTAFGMCSSFARVGSILASPMARILGPEACMLVFSATSLTASVLCWLVTPETLGRSLGAPMDNREGVRASMAEGGGAPRAKVDPSPGGVELRDGTKV